MFQQILLARSHLAVSTTKLWAFRVEWHWWYYGCRVGVDSASRIKEVIRAWKSAETRSTPAWSLCTSFPVVQHWIPRLYIGPSALKEITKAKIVGFILMMKIRMVNCLDKPWRKKHIQRDRLRLHTKTKTFIFLWVSPSNASKTS